MAGGFLRAAGDLFGGFLQNAGNSAYEIQRAVGGTAHDNAFAEAVEETKQHFHQCSRCGKWVCPEVCWNAKAGQCEDCAPNYEEEFAASHARAKADAARNQLYEKAQSTDYTSGVDMSADAVHAAPSRTAVSPVVEAANAPSIVGISCASCGTVANSKFCPECGQPMNAKLHCKACGGELQGRPKFCQECGSKVEYGG
jgi:uncharacterized OB-fold protein